MNKVTIQGAVLSVFLILTPWEELMADEKTSPVEVVHAFTKAMEAMDFDTGLTFVSADLEYINGPNPPVIGPAGVRSELEPFFAPIEENEFIIVREAAVGHIVFVERLDRHRIPQGWFELPVTGVYEVKDGKIVYWRDYFDANTIRSAMMALMETSE